MKKIASRLGVSPGSVHLWTSDIEITAEQAARNKLEAGLLRGAVWAEKNRQRRLRYQQEGRERARGGDALHQAGCMLYWAEGAKARNSVGFANSDVQMVRFFCRFIKEYFETPPERFTFSLNVYTGNGLSIGEVEGHWLEALELPRSCLRKHVINHFPTSSSGTKRHRLPYGVGRLCLNDSRVIQHIYGAIQEYAGFEEPRWLDGPPQKRRPKKRAPDRV
ncbi:MAG: hypothetical protein AABM29_00065 [Actinomycetota bacterium]